MKEIWKDIELTKLISLSEYVLNLNPSRGQIVDYATFLNRKLELGFFIATDDDGNVLEKPDIKNYTGKDTRNIDYYQDCIKYQQALKKVLFKGFEVRKLFKDRYYLEIDNETILIYEIGNNECKFGFGEEEKYKTIQDLVHLDLELTENCKI